MPKLSLVAAHGLPIAVTSVLQSTGARAHRLQEMWHMGLVAPRHVG